MTEDLDPILDAVGPRLREQRTRRGLRLADVSEQTGISVSILSRLEAGLRRPSLDVLLALSRLYRVPLDDLVGAPATGDPRIHPKPIRRNGSIFLPLSHHSGGVQAYKIILPPSKPNGTITQGTHEGYEWFYVLTGRVRLKLGDTETVFAPGEAAEFGTNTPHGMASATDTSAELLALFSPQGERIHVTG
ncbi:MAG: helix-turn-helix transcriptional regulator, partial [Microbacteriaceae bacterium]